MARKKLLTEGEIRQFMKLANLRPISKVRLHEMYPGARDEEEEMDLGGEEGLEGEEDLEGLEGEEDLEGLEGEEEMDLGAEEGGGEMVSMEDFMSALERAIEEVTGEEVEVSEEPGEEELEGEEELDIEL